MLYKNILEVGYNFNTIAETEDFALRSRRSIKKAINKIRTNDLPADIDPPPIEVMYIVT